MLLAALAISGCGEYTPVKAPGQSEPAVDRTTMLEEPELLYTKDDMHPSILVDMVGYEPDDDKIAVIEAKILPGRFEVVDSKTDEPVYYGDVRKRECTEDDETFTGFAEFTDLTEEGTYYIRTELLGRSNDFTIKEGIYEYLLDEAFKGLDGLRDENGVSGIIALEGDTSKNLRVSGGWYTGPDGQKDVCEVCLCVQDLLTAHDFFPKAASDKKGNGDKGNGIPDILDQAMYGADWLLKMQNPETGGVYTAIALNDSEISDEKRLSVMGETTRATAYFCTTMAKISVAVKRYDAKASAKYMEAANLAWKCLEANKELVDATQMFRAAVEMYRATGYGVYGDIINAYLKDNADKDYEERIALDGAVVYMSSTRNTNVTYCTKLMEHYMSRTEDKSNSANASRYLVESGDRDESVLLRNLVELVIVDYIISNQEYATIEKNYLHYFCGRNPQSEICSELSHNPDAYAEFIVLLYKLSLSKEGE